MSESLNVDQIAQWNGPSGEKWARHQSWLDVMLEEVGAAILAAAAPRPGESVIDIGCGAGFTSLELADAVGPKGRVLGVDVSQPLLAVARKRAEGRGNVSFAEGDAATHRFAAGAADLVFSRFGVMFFDAPEAAFRHIHGALKFDGRLAFVCWQGAAENPMFSIPMGILKRHTTVPAPTDPYAPGPTAFADAARTCAMLERAGFRHCLAAALDVPMVIGATAREAAEHMFEIGPAARLLTEAPDAVRAAVRDEMTAAFRADMTDKGVAEPARCWVITASA